jgi:transcriptional regulator with XRE-family HTH domain
MRESQRLSGATGTDPGATLRPSDWERVLAAGLAPLRQARGWTQEDLAHRSGLHRRTIMRIEGQATKRTHASRQTIDALAHAFGYGRRSDLWTALESVTRSGAGTPLVVGERVHRLILAFFDCTPQQQQVMESIILAWSARQQAHALGEAHLLDVDLMLNSDTPG